MQGILSKRVWRNLRQNFSKYAALMAIIVFCMVLVLSIVASADIITESCTNYSNRNKIEDGEFVTFVPLTEKEITELENKGLTIEKKFCLDFAAEDESIVRVFKNRKSINLVELIEGRHAENADEIVLEKRYCEEKAISVGGTISLGGKTLNICGIGMAPDYEGAFKNLGDASIDSKTFGPAWLNEDGYNALLNTGKSVQSEEFGYAYHLNGAMTHTELKEMLEGFEFEPEDVDDPYFKEYWEENGGKIDELKDGINELCDGMQELLDGIEELQSGVKKLRNGSNKGLSSAYSGAKRLKEGMGQTKSGMGEVTNGLAGLSGALPAGANEQFTRLYGGARALNGSMDSLYLGLDELTKGLSTLQSGNGSAMNELYNGTQELYDGAKELSDGINELKTESEEFFDELSEKTKMHNLELFLEQKDNPRIGGAIDDKRVDKAAGLVAGVIAMILFNYVISIFVTGEIDKESSVIGTLYALGVKKRDILLNYLQLPVAITFIAGVIGAFIGFSKPFIGFQTESMLLYFSMPEPPIKYPLYLIFYAVIMPPVTAFIINLIFISKKLDKAPLKLIRKEIKQPKISRINLNSLGFVQKFQIRQLIREFKGAAAVVLGMFISLLLLMMSFNCYIMCHHIIEDNRKDVTFNYMYSYKYPDKEPPNNSYEAYVESFKMEAQGFKFNISVLGITEENPYFKPTLKSNKTDVTISSAMAQKFALKEGDVFVLDDEENQRKYAFTVSEVMQYSPSFYVFMDIEQMRELFNAEDDYFNTVFSNEKLNIKPGKLFATTTKEDIDKAADVFWNLLQSMIIVFVVASVLVFVAVMYLMMKMMIDRSVKNISLLQIFGYHTNEIRRLYLDGNFLIVAIGAAIAIPLSKLCMNRLMPALTPNVACALNLSLPWQYFAITYGAIILLYFIINRILVFRINRITPAEILKDRD